MTICTLCALYPVGHSGKRKKYIYIYYMLVSEKCFIIRLSHRDIKNSEPQLSPQITGLTCIHYEN